MTWRGTKRNLKSHSVYFDFLRTILFRTWKEIKYFFFFMFLQKLILEFWDGVDPFSLPCMSSPRHHWDFGISDMHALGPLFKIRKWRWRLFSHSSRMSSAFGVFSVFHSVSPGCISLNFWFMFSFHFDKLDYISIERSNLVMSCKKLQQLLWRFRIELQQLWALNAADLDFMTVSVIQV